MGSTTVLPKERATSGVQTVHGLQEFQDAVSASFVPLEVSAVSAQPFHGLIRAGTCKGVHLTEVRATDHVVERTPALIADSTESYFKVSLLQAGRGVLVQGGREALLEPGNIAIYDTSRPYTLVFEGAFRSVVVMFPKRLVGLPAEVLAPLIAVPIDVRSGLGAIAAQHVVHLGANLEELQGSTGARLTHGALDLFMTLFLRELGLDETAEDPHRELFRRICDHIENHLGSTDLGPRSIAAAHYISTRYLHAVFQEQGTTVSTWIRARRLEQCRRDLSDPMYADRTVGAIASRWGFVDAAHFSRAFKSAFDRSPRDYRTAH